MRIGDRDTSDRVLVVAEIGNNHEGDPAVARELVEAAAGAGADAVKVQVFDPRFYISGRDAQRLEQLERFRLSHDDFAALAELAHARGLGFVATFLDLGSADAMQPLVDAFKIASGDNDNETFLRRAAASGLPVVVSLGMTEPGDPARIAALYEPERLALLHCVSAYPAPPEQAALATIRTLVRDLPGLTIGYSDHTVGAAAALAAVALGARIVEKHVTLSHEFSEFRDHQLSAEPAELRTLVEQIRLVEELVAVERTGLLPAEHPVAAAARRSLGAARDLVAGEVLSANDITWLRPAG